MNTTKTSNRRALELNFREDDISEGGQTNATQYDYITAKSTRFERGGGGESTKMAFQTI